MSNQILPSLSAEALAALSAAAPRYTSYPTVPHWPKGGALDVWHDAIAALNEPAAVYVHVPFCWKHCWYCGCNMVVSGKQQAGDRYLDAVEAQVTSLPLSAAPTPIRRIHLGGGTPTWLSPAQLTRLMTILRRRFVPTEDAELSAEVHPGVTGPAHLDALAAAGFTRLSVGVQSTSEQVLTGIGREQTLDDVIAVADGARERGMQGLNLDLVYGLPHQTPERWLQTLRGIEALRPDRLAIYGYAHVPWLRPSQEKIDATALPGPVERAELSLVAWNHLLQADYVAIGMDHFAKPHDALAKAASDGSLSRDFMGYTDRSAPLIGIGPSAISELGRTYIQQQSHLGAWYRAVEGDEPLLQRHALLTEEDDLRRDLIRGLMCHMAVDFKKLGERWAIDANAYFAGDIAGLEPWIHAGAVAMNDSGFEVTNNGRLLLRNIAAVFDTSMSGTAAWRVSPDRKTA